MLNLNDPLIVLTLFLLFTAAQCCGKSFTQVALCKWVDNPYVKECKLPPFPKPSFTDIQMCLKRYICTNWQTLSSYWLQMWFNFHIIINFFHEVSEQITCFIMLLVHKLHLWNMTWLDLHQTSFHKQKKMARTSMAIESEDGLHHKIHAFNIMHHKMHHEILPLVPLA